MYQGAAAAGIPGLAAVPQEGRRDRTGLRHPDRRAAGRQRALPGRACSVVWSWLAIVDRAWRLVMLPRTSGGDRQGEHMTVRAELAAVSGKAIAGFASYVRLSQRRQGHAGTYPRAHHLRLRVALQADHIQAARFQRHRYRLPLPAGSETLAASRRDRRRPPAPGMSRGHLQSGAMSSSRAQNRGSSPPRIPGYEGADADCGWRCAKLSSAGEMCCRPSRSAQRRSSDA